MLKLTIFQSTFSKNIACALVIGVALLLMGNVDLQTPQSLAASSVDLSTTITTIGQYGLLAWLIIRADARQVDLPRAWREERRYMIDLLVKQEHKSNEN